MHSQKCFLRGLPEHAAGLTRDSQRHTGLVPRPCSLPFLSSDLISPVFQSCSGLLGEASPNTPTPFTGASTSWCRLRRSLSSPSIQTHLCPLSLFTGVRPPTTLHCLGPEIQLSTKDPPPITTLAQDPERATATKDQNNCPAKKTRKQCQETHQLS